MAGGATLAERKRGPSDRIFLYNSSLSFFNICLSKSLYSSFTLLLVVLIFHSFSLFFTLLEEKPISLKQTQGYRKRRSSFISLDSQIRGLSL
ncbi:hypothetical protein FRX31_023010 [Thalictrum thalictroides]|uniref:Transmembrane protein n=1 Tax=Thalictrum thalictroides TaxID=46969 RepID=A0A7J6VT90_THATH|nr:hypothetical protein FRX31_023010 [Thalictrum thalictroides]